MPAPGASPEQRLEGALLAFDETLARLQGDSLEYDVTLALMHLLRVAEEVGPALNGRFPELRGRLAEHLARGSAGSDLIAACASARRSAPALARVAAGGTSEGSGLARAFDGALLGSGFTRGYRAGSLFLARRLAEIASSIKGCRALLVYGGNDAERFLKALRPGTPLRLTLVERSGEEAEPALVTARAAGASVSVISARPASLLRRMPALGEQDLIALPSLLPFMGDRSAARALAALRGLLARDGTLAAGSLDARNGARTFLRWTFASRIHLRGPAELGALATRAGLPSEALEVAGEPMGVRPLALIRP